MNKRIRKLTPATLKRIIAEEKFKIASKRDNKKSNKQLVEAYLKCLTILKEAKSKRKKDLKKIEEARRLLKLKLLKRV